LKEKAREIEREEKKRKEKKRKKERKKDKISLCFVKTFRRFSQLFVKLGPVLPPYPLPGEGRSVDSTHACPQLGPKFPGL
jgi:hypothetical protein